MRELKFPTSQAAWEGINEFFITDEEELLKEGGIRYGALLIAYDTYVDIFRSWVDPEFDFNRMFNYKIQKWRSLVSNYINFDYLDIVRSQVLEKEFKNTSNYNLSYLFDNSHTSGKGCLLSCTFSRRPKVGNPLLIVSVRASEVVKRLIFDLLLLHRMAEYVYGKDQAVGIRIYFPHMFASAETLAVYNTHKSIQRVLRKKGLKRNDLRPFQAKVLDKLDEFKSVNLDSIKYKVHLRAAKVIQGQQSGGQLLSKNCTI